MSEKTCSVRVGHARVSITPCSPVAMGGYSARGDRAFETVEDPLMADALFLEQGNVRVVLVVADLIAIDEDWGNRVRTGIATELSMPANHVVVLATHTHFGPQTRLARMTETQHQEWLESAVAAMIDCASWAAGRTDECLLKIGTADVGALMYNRRLRRSDGTCCTVYRLPLPEPDLEFGPVDSELTVLRFDNPSGKPVLLLTSVGIHPVVGGRDFYGISADYPGALRRAVEAVYGVPCIFALGTAGNVVPLQRGEGQRERLGRFLAGAACQAAETAEASAVRLGVVNERIDLPAKAGPIPFEITTLHLGDLGIVALPGEIFAETGLVLKQRSPFPKTLVLSLANQSTGYLPTRTAFWEGGYEAGATRMSEQSEALVVDNANRLLVELWKAGLVSCQAE